MNVHPWFISVALLAGCAIEAPGNNRISDRANATVSTDLTPSAADEYDKRHTASTATISARAARSRASIGLVGDPGDAVRATSAGTVLMGGGPDVDEAIQWMIDRAGGGDFVVIRVTGADAYNQYIFDLGPLNSVETLRIDSRELAFDRDVEQTIRDAEALFIAGGDQFDYVSLWKNSPVEDAINYLIRDKRVPIGGTSAGCAIQGEVYFDAANGTIRSRDAMRNPFDERISLGRGDFLDNVYLRDVVTDTHYDDPDRRGRHMTFLARMVVDWDLDAKGIGVDEATAVAIDEDGFARVFGTGLAFFLRQNGRDPEQCEAGRPLDWYRDRRAVEVYKIAGSAAGNGRFDLLSWRGLSGGQSQFYYVDRGRLGVSR